MVKRKCQSSITGLGEIVQETLHSFNSEEVKLLQQKLLKWYDVEKRDLPWRKFAAEMDKNKRAYAVWVSEIMLQQTQVATVIDYFNKWMKKWPTVESLAKANLEEVNEMWSGLGYYSRGRRLHEGAVKVVNELDGEIPNTAENLVKTLPGVGRYTAGAIASIAFNEKTGLVDGNVSRVFCRMRMIGADVSSSPVVEVLWNLANSSVDSKRPGDFNQGLMELGATVCTPKNPGCAMCPVKDLCKAYARVDLQKNMKKAPYEQGKSNKVDFVLKDIECLVEDCKLCFNEDENWDASLGVTNYPRKGKKKAPREEKSAVCIISKINDGKDNRQFLLMQRPEKGLLAGLWEFPSVTVDDISKTSCTDLMDEYLAEHFKIDVKIVNNRKSQGEVVHLFSHIHQTYIVESLEISQELNLDLSSRPCQWLSRAEFDQAAIPTAMKKVMRLYEGKDKKLSSQKLVKQKSDGKKQLSMDAFFKPKQ